MTDDRDVTAGMLHTTYRNTTQDLTGETATVTTDSPYDCCSRLFGLESLGRGRFRLVLLSSNDTICEDKCEVDKLKEGI